MPAGYRERAVEDIIGGREGLSVVRQRSVSSDGR